MRRFGWLVLLGGVVGYAAALGLLWWQQGALIFPQRVNSLTIAPVAARDDFQRINLTATDGLTLQVLQTPRRVPVNPTLVVAFGGNAHDVGGMALWLRQVFGSNTVVVAAPYRGYPSAVGIKQAGQPSQAALLADALTLTGWAQSTFQPRRTLLVGYSLGASVAAYTATQRPVSSTILITPFTSMADIAAAQYPWLIEPLLAPLLAHPFPTRRWLEQGQGPVVLLGAEFDDLVPASHLPALARAAAGRVQVSQVITGATHGGILDEPALPALLRQVTAPTSATTATVTPNPIP